MMKCKEAVELYNGLRKLEKISEAYNSWKDYRGKVTNFILENTTKGKTIAILGAGRCNDIDLSLLSKHLSCITLFDIDESAIQDGIKNYVIDGRCIVNTVIQDFVGISEQDYIQFATIIFEEIKKNSRNFSVFSIEDKAYKKMEEVYSKLKNYELDLGEKNFDYVLVLGVHSQLNIMFQCMWSTAMEVLKTIGNKIPYKAGEKILNRSKIETEYIIYKFDNAIYRMAKDNIFVGCESRILNRLGEIEGAKTGLENIANYEKIGKVQIVNWLDIVWPFDLTQDLQYKIAICNMEIL